MKKRIAILLAPLLFPLTFHAQDNKEKHHIEIPAVSDAGKVIIHTGFSLLYSEKHEQAAWVAYQLTREETQKAVERTEKFLPDPAVPTGSAVDSDYRKSGYDRGHMAPAADMAWSERSMAESFYFSNISPQVPACNRGVWKRLEEQVRTWAKTYGSVYVVTGPVLSDFLPAIGPDKVSVPDAHFKVILDYTEPDIKGIGFIVPNKGSDAWTGSFAVSIDSVESITRIDFFPTLPDHEENVVEKWICLRCWKWD